MCNASGAWEECRCFSFEVIKQFLKPFGHTCYFWHLTSVSLPHFLFIYQFLSWILPFQVYVCFHTYDIFATLSCSYISSLGMDSFVSKRAFILLKCQLPWKRWYFQLVWRRCVHHLSSLLGLCQRSLIDDSLPPHRAQMLFGTHWSNTSLLTDHRVPFK